MAKSYRYIQNVGLSLIAKAESGCSRGPCPGVRHRRVSKPRRNPVIGTGPISRTGGCRPSRGRTRPNPQLRHGSLYDPHQ